MTGWEKGSFLFRSDSEPLDDLLAAEIVRSASDAMIAEDLSGRVIFWNDAAARLLGHSAEEMVGQPIRLIVPPENRHEDGVLGARILAGERPTPFTTVRMTASGSPMMLSISTSPLRDHRHAIIGASHVLRTTERPTPADTRLDWTERKASHRILVVEDEFIVGLSLAATLENSGFEVLGPVCTVDEALELLAQERCALAILDVNLGRDETSERLAKWLKDEGVPFFVTSGYSADQRPAVMRGVPSFSKPVGARAILSAVHAILR
ncbi:MAG TPA: PAS domain S-box protein [Sphingobium sp.]|uniref:PAS domain S-box protein n=1 Tax=Sphingobium sp. TaxID=1912891 RepID=UPI002ED2E118